MKKILIPISLLLVIAVGYIGLSHFSGGAFPTFGLPIGGAEAHLRSLTLQFWEDIQFKDFDKAASYHPPDKQDDVDIPYLIERMFILKPEGLDIISYEIVFAEVDSSGRRARVKTRVKVKNLVNNDINDREIMLYYFRENQDSAWYMKLESSLHELKGDKDKVH